MSPQDEKPLVVVSEPLLPFALEKLRTQARLLQVAPQDLAGVMAEAQGLVVRTYTRVDAALLDAAPRLKVVGRAGVALDNIDLRAAAEHGVAVVHTPEANTLAVVDYTLAMMMQLNRRFWPMEAPLAPEEFHRVRGQTHGRFLADCRLGIIGCGRIGSRVARAALGLGMQVSVCDILPADKLDVADMCDRIHFCELDELLAEADIVTLHVPLDDSTHMLMDGARLAKCKPGAQLINAARGACLDAGALAEAVRRGHIANAAIDCHHPEPPPPDYPLWGLPGVILTPHVAARVPRAMENMSDVVEDVLRIFRGESPRYPAPKA